MGRNLGGERCIKSFDGGSTLSDANARRSEKFFEDVYRDLFAATKTYPSSDSRRNAIKIQIWVRLSGNLLMKLHQQRQKDRRSLYRLVTMVVIDVRY